MLELQRLCSYMQPAERAAVRYAAVHIRMAFGARGAMGRGALPRDCSGDCSGSHKLDNSLQRCSCFRTALFDLRLKTKQSGDGVRSLHSCPVRTQQQQHRQYDRSSALTYEYRSRISSSSSSSLSAPIYLLPRADVLPQVTTYRLFTPLVQA